MLQKIIKQVNPYSLLLQEEHRAFYTTEEASKAQEKIDIISNDLYLISLHVVTPENYKDIPSIKLESDSIYISSLEMKIDLVTKQLVY